MPKTSFVVVGTLVPLLMLIDGLYLSWKMRGVMTDMLGPPGPWLLMSTLPSWLASLLVSRAILLVKEANVRLPPMQTLARELAFQGEGRRAPNPT